MRNDKRMGGVDRSQQTYIFEISLSFCLSFFRFVWLIFLAWKIKDLNFCFRMALWLLNKRQTKTSISILRMLTAMA